MCRFSIDGQYVSEILFLAAEQLDGLFDDGGSGGGEGGEGEKEKRAIKNVVDAVRHTELLYRGTTPLTR